MKNQTLKVSDTKIPTRTEKNHKFLYNNSYFQT